MAANKKNSLTIITDTREQNPLTFSFPAERGTLATGDYSIKGLERFIAIERKEINDLVMCLKNGNRERFERELSRGRGLDYFALVIEADLEKLANGDYRSEMNPKSVMQFLIAFSVRYRLPIFFCPDRKYAARIIESLLSKYIEGQHKKLDTLGKN